MRFSLFLLLLSSLTIQAQGIGLHPPEVNWQQLNADHVRILFPEGYEARAQRAASLIDELATEHTRSVGEQLYDFDLVLQTPNMTVNGYVGLGPFRSEFYVTPPQSFNLLSNTDWVDLLTIHEFRHVQQNSNERRGLTKLVSYLQGQQGWAVLSGIATPNWFSEGDAVIAETALSAGGRGRTPAFSKELRSLLNQDIVYPYATARNGSFKHLVPDHYRYGYAMLSYARERFGNDVWRDVFQQGAAYRGLFYSFSRALKRETGLTTKQLYRATMDDLERLQDSSVQLRQPLVEGEPLPKADNDIRNYRFPFTDGQGRLLALRSSYRTLPALVVVGAPDSVITLVGIQREPWLDGGRRFAVWTEYRQDPRYTNQNYSTLIIYELATGRKRVIGERSHYVSASLSDDERQLVAVHYDPLRGDPELHLIDVASGEITDRIALDRNNLAWPNLSVDGSTVYFLSQTYGGVAIEAWDIPSDLVTTVLPRTDEPIDMLSLSGTGELVYTNGRSGVDNVYRLDPGSEQPEQLTDVAVGAYYPSLTDGTLVYGSPSPVGERLRVIEVARGLGLTAPAAPALSFFTRPEAFAAEAIDLPNTVTVEDYPVKNFSNTFGGIELHSWSFNGSYVTPGLEIALANALNTVNLAIDGRYNINEARYSGGVTATYGGLYPVIEVEGRYRDRNTTVQVARTDSLRLFGQEFSELTVGPTVRLPLQWVAGNQVTSLVSSVGYQYTALRNLEEGVLPDNFGNLSLGLSFSTLQRTAVRQVQPRLGLTAVVVYDRALGGESLGERLLLRSSAYLPGLFATHGVRLDFDLQREQAENLYQYPDVFRYARGYNAPLNDRVFRVGANYQLPLLYPDLGILGITYFKRIRLNAFYDYSRFAIDAFPAAEFDENSVGGQFFFDNVWLNAQLITIGVEVAYRLDRDLFSAESNDLRFQLLVSGGF